jgi:GT2 family glycosyltransferase
MPALPASESLIAQISVVIPTYQREQVLIDTIEYLSQLSPAPAEILVIDQTHNHESGTQNKLAGFQRDGKIRWIRMERPSITRAMNVGLREARYDIVMFLDDDIIPQPELISAHMAAHRQGKKVVAGQVLQPGESPVVVSDGFTPFRFNSTQRQFIDEFIGCNFSVNRRFALAIGGFDENFVHVAYRYEAEFADRALTVGERIFFEPDASIRHLKSERGGTRSYGHHLTTIRPSHAVGAYYFLLSSRNVPKRVLNLMGRPLRAVRTKHHATHPWWIPATLAAEVMGFIWAVFLYLRGPRLLDSRDLLR